jgi:hypothetical protein
VCVTLFYIAITSQNIFSKSIIPDNKVTKVVSVFSVKQQLEQAKKEGKAVFLIITGSGATGVDNAKKIADEAKTKFAKSLVITLNKDETVNSELVTKFGIATVQVPFILVLSPNGIAVAGFQLAQATSDALVKAIPSPKQDEVLFAVSEKKPVFIIVSKKGLKDKAAITSNCKAACSKIASKPTIIEIDVTDAKEANFLKQIGVTSITDKTVTVVANAAGQITGKYEGITLETTLVTSACKAGGGCCPGGSGKGCGPKK